MASSINPDSRQSGGSLDNPVPGFYLPDITGFEQFFKSRLIAHDANLNYVYYFSGIFIPLKIRVVMIFT